MPPEKSDQNEIPPAKTARQQVIFILTLNVALIAAWLFSGERFLDWIFEMPDFGSVDDSIIEFVVAAEELKGRFAPADLFGQTRAFLHQVLGIN
ncbi:MAG: hypothetical protein AAFR53_08850 [Pseudomonadota bacterium]